MKLAIGSDHGGFELKQVVMELLREEGVDYTDMGPETAESVDYPVSVSYTHLTLPTIA